MNCAGIFGRLLGHNYQARYSHGAPTYKPTADDHFWSGIHTDFGELIAASKAKTYCGDVCARCGHTVNFASERKA